jgi:hypothetical protein
MVGDPLALTPPIFPLTRAARGKGKSSPLLRRKRGGGFPFRGSCGVCRGGGGLERKQGERLQLIKDQKKSGALYSATRARPAALPVFFFFKKIAFFNSGRLPLTPPIFPLTRAARGKGKSSPLLRRKRGGGFPFRGSCGVCRGGRLVFIV